MIGAILASGIGRKAVVSLGVLAVVGGVILWLRWDAVNDFKTDQKAKANEARLEHIQGAKETRNEIENLGRDGFDDAIDGLPRRNPHN